MLQQRETMVMNPDPGSFSATANSKFQCSSPLIGPERISQDHLAAKAHAVISNIDATRITTNAAEEEGQRDDFQLQSARLSDIHLASRKANEAAGRRFKATSWLQRMVGPLDLPIEPSEEELRLCLRNGLVLCNLINKVYPGAVPKIVENPTPSSPPPQGAALSAYQYFENVRNFLVAIEEMKLPPFEASDLEKESLQMGSSDKVVDCILSLKAYHEWQQGGGQGFWKFGSNFRSPCALKSSSKPLVGSGRSLEPFIIPTSKVNNQIRKRWGASGQDGYKNFYDEFGSPNFGGQLNGIWRGQHTGDPLEETDNAWSSMDASASWVQHVSQKFVDVFRARNRTHEPPVVGLLGETDALDNMTSESLLKLVTIVLNDKQPEEVPVLVEFMLRTVMEEFEGRMSSQEEQLKRHQAKVLGDFPAGSNDLSEQQAKLQALQMELEQFKGIDQQHALRLELQTNELKELKSHLETTRLEFWGMHIEWEKEMKTLGVKLQSLAQAAAEYHKVAAENRELYNQVQDLKGNIRVYCRVRPFLPGQNSTRSTVDFIGEKGSVMIVNPAKQGKDQRKVFNFNKVFGQSVSQEEVFLDTQPLIRSVLDGYNVCIFAYGQTGSGKTYTMTGPTDTSPKDWGVNFRALHDLFQISQNRNDLMKYDVGVQMIEIYNEQVRDLLCTDGSTKKLEIRNSSQQNGLNVPDANMLPVECTEDVLELMTIGHKNRAVGATALNERSSRSHSVLTVHVKGVDLASGAILRGCLHLVDLAGSERVDKSEAAGERLKEAQHINKSLSALGDVIAALAQKTPHVPYRNSKLTQLLQDSLGGQAKTLMFVHISPDDESYAETISTLKFAERVATVELGAAQTNKESGEVRELKEQIAFLRDSLAKKDGELERIQKDARSKSIECVQDKSRAKAGTSPPNLFRRPSVDVVPGQANRRQPLEEVRNAEVRQSPSLGSTARKCVATSDIRSLDLMESLCPSEHRVFYCSQDDDSVKRRASKVPRQASPPEIRSSNCDVSVNATSTTRGANASKNKITNHSSEELEPVSRTPVGRVRSVRNYAVQSTGYGNETIKEIDVDRTDDNTRHAAVSLPFIRENGLLKQAGGINGSKFRDEMSPLSVHAAGVAYSEGAPKMRSEPRMMSCHSKRSSQSSRETDSQGYSTEGSTGPRGDFDEETSDYSEAEMWQKGTAAAPPSADQTKGGMLFASVGKLRQGVDRRRVSNQHYPNSHVKNERKVAASAGGGQLLAHTRSRRYSLVGSTTIGLESKKAGGKATLEAKLIAICSEDNGVECYAKTTLPRQPHVAEAVAVCNSKLSKRWL